MNNTLKAIKTMSHDELLQGYTWYDDNYEKAYKISNGIEVRNVGQDTSKELNFNRSNVFELTLVYLELQKLTDLKTSITDITRYVKLYYNISRLATIKLEGDDFSNTIFRNAAAIKTAISYISPSLSCYTENPRYLRAEYFKRLYNMPLAELRIRINEMQTSYDKFYDSVAPLLELA